MSLEKLQEILDLPHDLKVEIYEALTTDLYGDIESADNLTEEQKHELERRIKAVEEGSAKFYSWEEVERRLRKRN